MSDETGQPQDYVSLGRVTGAYGVLGWVRVHSFTDPRTNILSYPHWQVGVDQAHSEAYRLADGRAQGKALVAKLDGLDDRDQAQALANQTIWVRRSALPDCEPGEYYWTDLEGLAVETVDGRTLGTVDYLIETGANDVLVVKGVREVLIPFVAGDVIKSVDVEDGKIVVDWDDSYLD